MTEWRWGCLLCLESGPADSARQAVGKERAHRAYACPAAPGLDPAERRRRRAWWEARRERYGLDGAGGTQLPAEQRARNWAGSALAGGGEVT